MLVFSTCNNNPSFPAGSSPSRPGDQFMTFPILANYGSIANPRERWEAYHLTNYVIQQVSTGAWVPSDTVQIYVVDSRKALVVRSSEQDTMPTRYPFYRTVEDLFAMADGVRDHLLPGDSLIVEYDPRFGFPSKIEFFTSRISDADFGYATWNLRRIFNPGTTSPNTANNDVGKGFTK
jgi:hypothetical protein